MPSEFESRNKEMSAKMAEDKNLQKLSRDWLVESSKYEYSYHYSWLGRPIIQFPQDIMALQEIIWNVKPKVIIETGVAHGGSLIFYASMLELLGNDGRVIGIEIDLREHNRVEIEKHPLSKRIDLVDGSSVSAETLKVVENMVAGNSPVLVVLDSNHTHEHVFQELKMYSQFVTTGSYLAVLDTVIEDMPADTFPNRPWGKGDNPKTAVHEFLKNAKDFEVDQELENKLLISVAPSGYLKRVSNTDT